MYHPVIHSTKAPKTIFYTKERFENKKGPNCIITDVCVAGGPGAFARGPRWLCRFQKVAPGARAQGMDCGMDVYQPAGEIRVDEK